MRLALDGDARPLLRVQVNVGARDVVVAGDEVRAEVQGEGGGIENVGRGLGVVVDSVLAGVGGDDASVVRLGVGGGDSTVEQSADSVLDAVVNLLSVLLLANDAENLDEVLACSSAPPPRLSRLTVAVGLDVTRLAVRHCWKRFWFGRGVESEERKRELWLLLEKTTSSRSGYICVHTPDLGWSDQTKGVMHGRCPVPARCAHLR